MNAKEYINVYQNMQYAEYANYITQTMLYY